MDKRGKQSYNTFHKSHIFLDIQIVICIFKIHIAGSGRRISTNDGKEYKEVRVGSRCFVICEKEQAYADRLALMLAKKIDFQIYVCGSVEQVKVISREKGIEILLIGESYDDWERREIEAGETIVLVNEAASGMKEKHIYKYQPADVILSEVLAVCMEDHHSGIFRQQLYRESCLIGIYSPVHRIGNTTFAIALGKELAKKERVLYLNLETYSGWKERFLQKEQYTLADLLYYARQENSNLEVRLGMMTGNLEGLEYVAPMDISEDLKKVTIEEWKELLEQLLSLRMYKKIIIDFGECVQGLWELLELCRTIYMAVSRQPEAHAKIIQFERNAKVLGYGDLLKKIVQWESGDDLEGCIRQLLQKEEENDDTGRTASWKDFAGDRSYRGSVR